MKSSREFLKDTIFYRPKAKKIAWILCLCKEDELSDDQLDEIYNYIRDKYDIEWK